MSEQPADAGSEPEVDAPSGEAAEAIGADGTEAIPDEGGDGTPGEPGPSAADGEPGPSAADGEPGPSTANADAVLPSWDVAGATTDPFPAVAAEVASSLGGDSSGHDLAHAWRVFDLGRSIAEEAGADLEVVGLAGLTHDLHRVAGPAGEYVHPEETLDDVADVLRSAGVEAEATIDAVQHCVAVHDDYSFRGDPDRVETVEAAVVQDADNLDALGAVGIGRTFTFGGDRGVPMWAPGANGASTATDVGDGPEDVSSEGEAPSTIDHAYEKLLRLDEELHTDAAREIAEDRLAFFEAFVERFEREWRGEL